MHTFKGRDGTFIHHNSDLSGDVIIHPKGKEKSFEVDGYVLLEFIADYVSRQQISKLEQSSPEEILGLEPKKFHHKHKERK